MQRPEGYNAKKDPKGMVDAKTGEKKPIPRWANSLIGWGWNRKITPNSVIRFTGKKALGQLRKNMRNLSDTFSDEQVEIISDYQYQMVMRPPSTETCLMIMFAPGMVCHHPLEAPEKLGNKEFPIPVSFIYGENDWVPLYEEQAP